MSDRDIDAVVARLTEDAYDIVFEWYQDGRRDGTEYRMFIMRGHLKMCDSSWIEGLLVKNPTARVLLRCETKDGKVYEPK